jgi:hypothetical protein
MLYKAMVFLPALALLALLLLPRKRPVADGLEAWVDRVCVELARKMETK